jgi:hypothetical protein
MARISPICKKCKNFISALKSPTFRDFMIIKSLESKRSKSHTWAPLRRVINDDLYNVEPPSMYLMGDQEGVEKEPLMEPTSLSISSLSSWYSFTSVLEGTATYRHSYSSTSYTDKK